MISLANFVKSDNLANDKNFTHVDYYAYLITSFKIDVTIYKYNIYFYSIFLWVLAFNCHNNSILDQKYMELHTNM